LSLCIDPLPPDCTAILQTLQYYVQMILHDGT
jgi:hypothetical protein